MSLQAYCSILYLKPRTQIIIRGQKVKTQLVSKSLAYIERDVYRPKFLVSFIFLFMMLCGAMSVSCIPPPFLLSMRILILSNFALIYALLYSVTNEIERMICRE